MFTQQDNEYQKHENEKFYKLQNEFVKENNLQIKRNDYLCNEFFQHIVITYQKDKTTNSWLFGKALDILIRNNISSKSFIQYNEETKQDFYSNAMYRCNNFTIKSFNPNMNAFIYFTSTIKNAFKEELNKANEQKNLAKQLYHKKGLDSIMYNVDVKSQESLHQEYIPNKQHEARLESIPYFIQEVYTRYSKDYKISSISLPEDETAHRFQMKYHKFETFIQVENHKNIVTSEKTGKQKTVNSPIGVVIEYIDLQKMNENTGMYKHYLQKRALVARKNGHQCFLLFSDIWNDENIEDKLIFARLDYVIRSIKDKIDYNSGKDLMLDYIPYKLIENFGVTEPAWWLLDEDLKDRHIVLDQAVEEYIKYKDINPKYTRVFDAGFLKIK